jgi:hypothetical protein
MAHKGSSITSIDAVAANWKISTREQSRGLYALALVPVDFINGAGSYYAARRTLEKLKGPTEFIFDVNPQSMDMEEPVAVQIVPTQDGGQFIEHQGQIYKTINISGTTGLRPGRKRGAVIPVLNVPNPFSKPDTNPRTGLPKGEVSGFEQLLQLRNLFRHYFDIKEDPATAHKFVLVWQNGKEGEFYVVEPISFRTRRESSSPLTSEYEIQLRTIARADRFIAAVSVDTRTQRNLFARSTEFISEQNYRLGNALRVAHSLVDRTSSVARATHTLGTTSRNLILSAASDLFNALVNVNAASSRAFSIPRETVEFLANSSFDLMVELEKIQNNAYKTQGLSTQLSSVWSSYRGIFRVATAVAARDQLYGGTVSTKFRTRNVAYRNPSSGPPRTGGSPTDLQNVTIPTGTALSSVGSVDTIFSLAMRLLGDQARWKELVVLNALSAPYISVDGDGKDVLRPGDTILFPAGASSGETGIQEDSTKGASALVQRLGRDVRLDSYGETGGLTALDLAINNRGDIALVEGVDNLVQSVEIKFSTERGSLPTHPTFGISAPIGSKATIRSLVAFQMDVRGSLLADSRIDEVSSLDFDINGNVLSIRADVQIAEVDQGVAISFDARR